MIVCALALEYAPRAFRFEAGEPSPETVISSREFEIVDEEATQGQRQQERERIKALFVAAGARSEAVSRLGEFLRTADELSGQEGELTEKVATLWSRGGQALDAGHLEALLKVSDEELTLLSTASVGLLNAVMSEPVSNDNLAARKREIYEQADHLPMDGDLQETAAVLAAAFLSTNTAYPSEVIEKEMDTAAASVQPVMARFAVGQKIVEKGDIVTTSVLTALEQNGALSRGGNYQQALGAGLTAILLYAVAAFFFMRFRPAMVEDWRMTATICTAVLIFFALARVFGFFAEYDPVWGYLVPLAMLGFTMAVLLDHLTAMFLVMVGTALTGLAVKGNLCLTLAALLAGAAGVIAIKGVKDREDLIKSMAGTALFISAACAAFESMTGNLRLIAMAGGLGLANGVFSGVLTLGLLPFLERIARIATPMRLMELASPDHPLMKELISKAPGTYSHSIVVGNLASAAAQEIGADPTLARVGSYYHDVGKIKRASFFVENQPQGRNSHEKIKPNLSALVITAHVKEGVELAQEHHLPREIIDIIKQHHGTSLVRYFYALALKQESKDAPVSEGRFRYPGEKPRSKEAALVMLADAIEAAAKALEKPTPARLEQLTRSLIREKTEDGQLSESNLTMGDLEKIASAFVRILSGMYHVRVGYPALVKSEGMR